MISEGPALIEALPGELQNTLNGALRPGEELLIAVRGNVREALAATPERMLLLKEPAIAGLSPVEVREIPLSTVSQVQATPRPVGGRLVWESTQAGVPLSFDYPTYDAAKFTLVAKRLLEMIGERRNPTTPAGGSATGPAGDPSARTAGAPSARPCPKCAAAIPESGSWCPNCGLQAFDPCWGCGRALGAADNFCAYCGTPNTEPAVVQCPKCQAAVGQGKAYCAECGTQARTVCADCERPLRRDWKHCPYCAGEPVWEEQGIETEVAHLTGKEPDDPSAWLRTTDQARDAEDLNQRGIKAYEAQNLQEAARLFREAVEADPDNARFWTNLGVAYGELGDDLQAFSAYRRAVELNPEEVSAYLNMGYLYMERERTPEAREMWEAVIRISPDSEEAEEARQNLASADEV